MKRILLILLAAGFWHSSASAADYYWTPSSGPLANTMYNSPQAACTAWALSSSSYTDGRSVGTSDTARDCRGIKSNGTWVLLGPVIRRGDSCPAGSDYNPATGECVAPLGTPGEACEEDEPALTGFGRIQNSEGQCVDFTRADTPAQCKSLADKTGFTTIYVTFDSDGNPQTPPPTSTNGCETRVATVAHCTMAPARPFGVNGQIQSVVNKCRVAVSFTGETAGPGPLSVSTGPDTDGACDPATECSDPSPAPIENESKPCTYVEDGEGRRHCSSNNFNYKPGESSCGSVNGQFTCIGKAPQGDATKIDTTITEKDNGDGTKTITKEDTATVTKCIGSYSCKTEVTNNKTVTVKDGNGNTVSESGACTGPACSDKKGKGGMDSCAIGEECSGDDEFGGPDNEEAAGIGDSTQSFMDRVSGAPIVAAASGLTFSGGGSCSFGSFSVPVLGTLSLQPMCNWANDWFAPLKALMLCLWALVAVRTFFEA